MKARQWKQCKRAQALSPKGRKQTKMTKQMERKAEKTQTKLIAEQTAQKIVRVLCIHSLPDDKNTSKQTRLKCLSCMFRI